MQQTDRHEKYTIDNNREFYNYNGKKGLQAN